MTMNDNELNHMGNQLNDNDQAIRFQQVEFCVEIKTKHIPTWECLRAPTSFVPSPHISTTYPRFFIFVTTNSFCFGSTLANTRMWMRIFFSKATVSSDFNKKANPYKQLINRIRSNQLAILK